MFFRLFIDVMFLGSFSLAFLFTSHIFQGGVPQLHCVFFSLKLISSCCLEFLGVHGFFTLCIACVRPENAIQMKNWKLNFKKYITTSRGHRRPGTQLVADDATSHLNQQLAPHSFRVFAAKTGVNNILNGSLIGDIAFLNLQPRALCWWPISLWPLYMFLVIYFLLIF